jgi:hypothetical protein
MRVRLVLVVAALAVGGCTRNAPPADSPAVPVFSTAPATGTERTVPDDCAEVATLDDLSRILDTFVSGPVQRIVGVPQDDIGRTGRLDCYYGVPDGQPVAGARVWIALTGYVNEESARKRMTATVADERSAGATAGVSEVAVGQERGVLIRNANWMLVAGRGGPPWSCRPSRRSCGRTTRARCSVRWPTSRSRLTDRMPACFG